ncbi:MAG TPA: SDR family NAD(P)-dependent oxidoreductase [Acidimicrobiales bacterium]|nr:SDR family NAD(P)-dependent oxidoreductase [Acidimicrobiales bacterium]
MSELRFDGRVAVVTGAGRGLGRAHALLLAERGARVVVNDLGGSIGGSGTDAEPASDVAAEIVRAGGDAVADTSDVSVPSGAEALIDAAVARFGRIDVLVNNAGIVRWAGFPDADEENLARHLAVHVGGSFHTTRAAWPHMSAQGYGRVVMTTSTGMLGLPANTSYATAKGGVFGLARSLATAGAPLGIKVNLVAPAAMTRMARRPSEADAGDAGVEDPMSPHLVAPMVAYLAHESCPVTGELYAAGAGRFARIFLACAPGYVHPGGEPDAGPSIEDVAAHWDTINDEAGYSVPADLPSWSATFLSHLEPGG